MPRYLLSANELHKESMETDVYWRTKYGADLSVEILTGEGYEAFPLVMIIPNYFILIGGYPEFEHNVGGILNEKSGEFLIQVPLELCRNVFNYSGYILDTCLKKRPTGE